MAAVIVSDYFYGEESEQFSYFRIPHLLITHRRFKNISVEAELLYGLLLDRIEHFCVLPSMRNQHYGQKILAALQKQPLILEIGPPVDAIAQRRKGFYERCGFVENPYPHTHPPYHAGTPGHDLVVMSSPTVLAPEEYETFRRALCDMVMCKVF